MVIHIVSRASFSGRQLQNLCFLVAFARLRRPRCMFRSQALRRSDAADNEIVHSQIHSRNIGQYHNYKTDRLVSLETLCNDTDL